MIEVKGVDVTFGEFEEVSPKDGDDWSAQLKLKLGFLEFFNEDDV